jgi:predicted MFS family arabinose efflux permease
VGRLAKRWGNRRLNTVGGLALSTYPLFTALTPNLAVHVANNLLGGLAWALIGGALGNWLLEKIPATDRPAYLAWYNLALNAAILAGSLCGSLLAGQIGLGNALIVASVLRLGAGLLLWRTR